MKVETDLALGGRWTSLRSTGTAGEREWLWHNPAVSLRARAGARPGSAFVDAGGGEECLPSVTGAVEDGHDHGDVWYRSWVGEPHDAAALTRDGLTLHRRLHAEPARVRVDYEITGRPGTPFLHALHLLLDLSEAATVHVPGAPAVVVQDRPAPGETRLTTWPDGDAVDLSLLGPDDGTARCAVVATDAVEVRDGDHRLSMRWGSEPGVPVALVLWRNLRGWPDGGPYRSVGVEPMVGATTALASARPGETAVLGAGGALSWWLELSDPVRRPAAPAR